jgi:hypothetical protein
MAKTNWKITSIAFVGVLISTVISGSALALAGQQAPLSTPVAALTFTGWSKGCTGGPYITCSASVTKIQTDPYRLDFEIEYTYNDNRTNMGSTFTLNLVFDTGVFYTDVPIYWVMYPVTNEVMPNRWIDVVYPVSDLNPMPYPSGSWTVPAQPSPYDTFTVKFSRATGAAERLVRTDKWHFTIATYPICRGGSCNGLNPETMGCGADAQTYTSIPLEDPNNNEIGIIQNRDSQNCLAQWEKTLNLSGSDMYAEGSIRWGGVDYTPNIQSVSSPGSIENTDSVYTPIYGSDSGLGSALNCGNLSPSGPIYPPSQPINLNSPYGLNNCIAR